MPKPVGSAQRYMPGLDGLRALAVRAVIAYHLQLGWAPGGLLHHGENGEEKNGRLQQDLSMLEGT